MFITVNCIETNSPTIINTAHLIAIVANADGEGNVYVKMSGSDHPFKIVETIDQMATLLK